VPLVLAFHGGGYDVVLRQQSALIWLWLMALAVAFGFLPSARLSRSARLIAFALAALALWTALSPIWSESVERTSIEIARTVAYAGVLGAIVLGLNSSTWRAAAYGLCAALLTMPVLSLVSRIGPGIFSVSAYPSSFAGNRLLFPLDYWNAVACWSAMAIAAGLAISAHTRDWRRPLSLALVPVAITTLYLTYSRGGVASAIAGTLVVLAVSRNRVTAAAHALVAIAGGAICILAVVSQPAIADGTSGRGGLVVAIAIAIAAALCGAATERSGVRGLDRRSVELPAPRTMLISGLVVVAVAIGVAGPSLTARESRAFSDRSSVSNQPDPARLVTLDGPRAEIWSSAFRAFESEPLTGIGPGTFAYWWQRDVTDGDQLQDAHSLYIETLAELGIPGLLILLGLIAALLAGALKARAAASRARDAGAATAMIGVGAVFLVQAGVDWMWEIPALTLPGLGALAIATSSLSHRRRTGRSLSSGRLALTALCIVAGATQIPGLITTESLRTSAELAPNGFTQRAGDLAVDAREASPWAASPHSQLALI